MIKDLAILGFVVAIVASGAPPLALLLGVIGLILVVAAHWP